MLGKNGWKITISRIKKIGFYFGYSMALADHVLAVTPTATPNTLMETPPARTTLAIVNSTTPPNLTINELLNGVLTTHPGLKSAQFQARAALQDVQATERLRWPTLSVTAESERQGNNTAFSASRLVRAEQTLWDFGRIGGKIGEANAAAVVADTTTDLTKQDLFLQVINAWQQLNGALEKEKVALRALGLLGGYQTQMNRRVEAKASPQIDLELVNARLLQTEVELTSLRTQIAQTLTRLELLSGLNNLSTRLHSVQTTPSMVAIENFAIEIKQTDWNSVASEHTTVKKAKHDYDILTQRFESKMAELMPQVYLRVDKPLDTNASINSTKPSYFVGLRFTPAAGFAGQAEAKAMHTRLRGQVLNIETAERDILQTLLNDRDDFLNARLRHDALSKSVQGSQVVLDSYLRQFQAGRKSWQDLLNAARELAQNEYAQVDALMTISVTMNRLKLRMELPLD